MSWKLNLIRPIISLSTAQWLICILNSSLKYVSVMCKNQNNILDKLCNFPSNWRPNAWDNSDILWLIHLHFMKLNLTFLIRIYDTFDQEILPLKSCYFLGFLLIVWFSPSISAPWHPASVAPVMLGDRGAPCKFPLPVWHVCHYQLTKKGANQISKYLTMKLLSEAIDIWQKFYSICRAAKLCTYYRVFCQIQQYISL